MPPKDAKPPRRSGLATSRLGTAAPVQSLQPTERGTHDHKPRLLTRSGFLTIPDGCIRSPRAHTVDGGGVLGIVMFVLGFLKWLEIGEGDTQQEFSGFAWSMPTTAVIGFSLAAGLIALLGATEPRRGRGVPSAIPTGLAATGLLLAIGIYLGRPRSARTSAPRSASRSVLSLDCPRRPCRRSFSAWGWQAVGTMTSTPTSLGRGPERTRLEEGPA